MVGLCVVFICVVCLGAVGYFYILNKDEKTNEVNRRNKIKEVFCSLNEGSNFETVVNILNNNGLTTELCTSEMRGSKEYKEYNVTLWWNTSDNDIDNILGTNNMYGHSNNMLQDVKPASMTFLFENDKLCLKSQNGVL